MKQPIYTEMSRNIALQRRAGGSKVLIIEQGKKITTRSYMFIEMCQPLFCSEKLFSTKTMLKPEANAV